MTLAGANARSAPGTSKAAPKNPLVKWGSISSFFSGLPPGIARKWFPDFKNQHRFEERRGSVIVGGDLRGFSLHPRYPRYPWFTPFSAGAREGPLQIGVIGR